MQNLRHSRQGLRFSSSNSEYSSRFVQNTFLIDQQSSTSMTTLSENQAAAWDRRETVMLPLLADGLDVRKVPFRSVLPVKRFR